MAARDPLRNHPAVAASLKFAHILEAARVLEEGRFSEESVCHAFATVGRGLRVDRLYLAQNVVDDQGRLRFRVRNEWCAELVEPRGGEAGEGTAYAELGDKWSEVLGAGELLSGGPEAFHGQARRLLERHAVRSCLICPIELPRGRGGAGGASWWGLIGLDDCKAQRRWPFDEIVAARTLARTFSAGIESLERPTIAEALVKIGAQRPVRRRHGGRRS